MAPDAARIPLTATLPGPAETFQFHAHRDGHVWAWSAAIGLAAELRRDLERQSRSRLLLPGVPLAAPVLRALARAPLDWGRIDVGLVDECWLLPEDPDSRAAVVRANLLQDHASAMRLETLTRPGLTIESAVATANAHAQQTPAAVVLALGDEGEVASLTVESPDYRRAIHSPQAFTSLAVGADAGCRRRISATPAGLARARCRVLLLRGDAQRRLFEEAVEGADPMRSPLAAVLAAGGPVLHAHWCPQPG